MHSEFHRLHFSVSSCNTELGNKVGPRLRELASRCRREPGGGIDSRNLGSTSKSTSVKHSFAALFAMGPLAQINLAEDCVVTKLVLLQCRVEQSLSGVVDGNMSGIGMVL